MSLNPHLAFRTTRSVFAGYCSARSSGGRSFEGVRSSPPIQMPEPTSRTREVWATSVQHTPIGSPELSGAHAAHAVQVAAVQVAAVQVAAVQVAAVQ
eukprot:2401095-Pleurochrysis_carterae.AAC.1